MSKSRLPRYFAVSFSQSSAPNISLLFSQLFPPLYKHSENGLNRGGCTSGEDTCVDAIRNSALCNPLATTLRVSSAPWHQHPWHRGNVPPTLALVWPAHFLSNFCPYLSNVKSIFSRKSSQMSISINKNSRSCNYLTFDHTYTFLLNWCVCMCSKATLFMNTKIWVSGNFQIPLNMLH